MFETNFDFDYNRYKLNAVIDCFHHEEEELRMELINHMEKLYDELVPPEVKEQVDAEIVAEHNRQWKEDNCFALIRMHNMDEDEFFLAAKGINSLYDAALKYYCDFIYMKDEYTLDCLVDKFDSYDYLDEPVFNVLSDAQANDKRISCEVHYDFEVGTLEMRGSDGTMVGYDMNVISDILDRTESDKFNEAQKRAKFDEEIKSYLQEINVEGENEGSPMRL